MEHDPLCPLGKRDTTHQSWGFVECRCDEYAKVRADERERCECPMPFCGDHDPVPGLVARGVMSNEHDPDSCDADCCRERDTLADLRAKEAEVRERIAQKIEDEHGEDCYDPFLVCTHNEDAAIARGKPS